jgi:hypothetical protein
MLAAIPIHITTRNQVAGALACKIGVRAVAAAGSEPSEAMGTS